MLSFQDQYTQAQDIIQDTDTTILTFLKRNINIGLHILETELGSFYTEDTRTDLTTTSDTYQTPDNYVRLKQLYVTIGTTRYPTTEVFDEELWQHMKQTVQTSSYPTHCFFRRETYELFPTPATSSYTITIIYEASHKELSAADYSTGTITTLANGGTAVTASGSTFTTAMAGRYFKINAYPIWYPISAYGSATTLTLQKKYQGTAIAAGTSAYTIGEMPRTPESTHIIPVHYAIMAYYQLKQAEEKALMFKDMYDKGMAMAKATYGRRYSSKVIPSQNGIRGGFASINPNFFPRDLS